MTKKVLGLLHRTGSFRAECRNCRELLPFGVDASESGVAQARENVGLNGLSRPFTFQCADVL